jgi:hypothetical protein
VTPHSRTRAQIDAGELHRSRAVDGARIEWMRLDHTLTELYDVAALPQSRQAEAAGFVATTSSARSASSRREPEPRQ